MQRSTIVGVAILMAGLMDSRASAQGTYLESPMNLEAKKFPYNFVGHNPVEVYNGTYGKQVAKGKYETTAEYEARSKSAKMAPLFGKVYMWSPIAFAMPKSWTDYDADAEVLKAHFALSKSYQYSGGNFDSSKEVLGIIPWVWTEREGSYDAQNGFGAGVKVYTKSEVGYGFQITNWKDFGFVPTSEAGTKYRVTCTVNVAPSNAPRLETCIRVLYIGYLTAPYRAQDYAGETPTYSSPFSFSGKYNYACIRLKTIWFYDAMTGFIYGKMSPKSK